MSLEILSTMIDHSKLEVNILMELIEFCLMKCCFRFCRDFYTDGVSIGGNLSCIVTNIYMTQFERMALDSAATLFDGT